MKTINHLLLVSLFGANVNLQAAPVFIPLAPAAVQSLDKNLIERYLEEEKLKKAVPEKPVIKVPEQAKPVVKASDLKNIWLKDFKLDPSEILTTKEINKALDSYKQQNVSLQDLFDAVNKLNSLYDAKGEKTARAILPPQDIKEGIIKIRLIEARLGEVQVSGTVVLDSEFVRSRIHQKPGELVSVPKLESDLIRYNALYESQLSAGVAAGAKVGTTDITIAVRESKRYELTTFVDNAGRESVGKERIGTIYKAKNLMGYNDSLQFVATGTKGSTSYGLSYSIPVSQDDLRLDVAYNQGEIELVNGAFVPLDITGSSQDLTAGLTQPFWVGTNRQWAGYGRISTKNSVSEFSGFVQEDLNVNVFSLGVSGDAHYNDYAWSIDNSLNVGSSDSDDKSSFTYYKASGTLIDRVSESITLLVRAGLQYSFNDVLPSGEQFQVGGLYTVRGFSEGLLSGRHGYFVSVEGRTPLYSSAMQSANYWPSNVQGFAFLDHGGAFPFEVGKSINSDDYLTSAGGGLLIDFGPKISARIAVAYPLQEDSAELDNSLKIHAGLNISWL
ncbi:MAG: hemolysin activation/secretion protein [Psychromonas sp.]|jgi:hemolysin activation/secretion protein